MEETKLEKLRKERKCILLQIQELVAKLKDINYDIETLVYQKGYNEGQITP